MKPLPGLLVAQTVSLLVTMIGCTAPGHDLRAPAQLEPPLPAVNVATPPASLATVSIVRHFDAAKAREIGIVLGPDITAQQIDEIRAADRRARNALTNLGRQIHHPSVAAMAEAREAVQALENALH